MPEPEFHLPTSLKSLHVTSPTDAKLAELRHASEVPAPVRDEVACVSHVNRREGAGLESLAHHPLEEPIVRALRTLYDPELPVNIYDLGLIYDIRISPENRVHVNMTLTAPACPVAGTLPPEVVRKIKTVPGVADATVELVWQPTWAREMMSEVARLELGI